MSTQSQSGEVSHPSDPSYFREIWSLGGPHKLSPDHLTESGNTGCKPHKPVTQYTRFTSGLCCYRLLLSESPAWDGLITQHRLALEKPVLLAACCGELCTNLSHLFPRVLLALPSLAGAGCLISLCLLSWAWLSSSTFQPESSHSIIPDTIRCRVFLSKNIQGPALLFG